MIGIEEGAKLLEQEIYTDTNETIVANIGKETENHTNILNEAKENNSSSEASNVNKNLNNDQYNKENGHSNENTYDDEPWLNPDGSLIGEQGVNRELEKLMAVTILIKQLGISLIKSLGIKK